MRIYSCFATIVMVASFLIPPSAHAGQIEVRPTLLTITPSQRVAILSLNNPEAGTEIYQARIYRWQQTGDKQTLEPSNDVIASPPIITLAPHSHQILRIGVRVKDLPQGEETYRLILEEVPNTQETGSQGLNIALRISLPLFVRPQIVPPPARLQADVTLSGEQASVTVHNTGRFTTRIVNVVMHNPASGDDLEQKCLTYILPGGWNTYTFNLPSTPAMFNEAALTLQADEGDINLKAPVDYAMNANVLQPAAH